MGKLAAVVGLTVLLGACAARTASMPPPPAVLRHPEFRYPVVPDGIDSVQATRIERGWRYLQSDSLRNAEREFQSALKLQPSFHPAETGMGYVELARRETKGALTRFDRALVTVSDYAPALVGRGQALLEAGRDGDALVSFEAALKADPSLTDLHGRVEVLRFRAVQDNIARAKQASEAGRLDEARAAYAQAIAASPDSSFLYRDLALVERKAGDHEMALDHFRKALSVDPADARSHAQVGAILEEQGDIAGAIASYEKARSIDPDEVPAEILARARAAVALARLPAEYRGIPSASTVTRGDVAALIGVRLAPLVAQARPRQAVVTDVRGHWAQQWILPVVRSGVMDTQPNYTFQPRGAVRRGDLANTVSRVLNLIGTARPALAKAWQGAKVKMADVPPAHLSYPAVSQAVASGVMALDEAGSFHLLRPVTGSEVIEVMSRLEALAKP